MSDRNTTTETTTPRIDPDPITNRSEIVFLYDAKDSNLNGNPLTEENRPRIDSFTGHARVTDVRLKRVVRDYLDRLGESILIKASGDDGRDDQNDRYAILQEEMRPLMDEDGPNLSEEDAFLAVATDIRMFGSAMMFDTEINAQYTGPVQFSFGNSMHAVNETAHGKTSVLPPSSDEDDRAEGGNMFTDYRVDYALMRFHGVVNENNAADTHLTDEDVELLENGLWSGTRNGTNTATKQGHEPRLLARVEYDSDDYHIGDLHRSFEYQPVEVSDERAIRDITDGVLDATEFIRLLEQHADDIDTAHVRASRRLRVRVPNADDGGALDLENAMHEALDADSVAFRVE